MGGWKRETKIGTGRAIVWERGVRVEMEREGWRVKREMGSGERYRGERGVWERGVRVGKGEREVCQLLLLLVVPPAAASSCKLFCSKLCSSNKLM